MFLGERLCSEDDLAPALGGLVVQRTPSPVLSLNGDSFEQFLSSRGRNFRQEVKRRAKVLSEVGAEYRLTNDPAEVHRDMQTLVRLHSARWGRSGSTVFGGRAAGFHTDFACRALSQGWLRLWTMRIRGNPVAAWYGLRYGGIESYYQAGRDPEFDHLGVGFVLLCHSVMAAFEDGVREYHFGSGGEPYKYRFSNQDPGLETVAVHVGLPGSFINGRAPGWPGRGNVRLRRENAGCETAFPISGGSPKWCSVMGWFQS
jgi:CelD/BcsL family acetyltransferase involved in cellulose biosynthesis